MRCVRLAVYVLFTRFIDLMVKSNTNPSNLASSTLLWVWLPCDGVGSCFATMEMVYSIERRVKWGMQIRLKISPWIKIRAKMSLLQAKSKIQLGPKSGWIRNCRIRKVVKSYLALNPKSGQKYFKIRQSVRLFRPSIKSVYVAKCRGSWVVGRGRRSWVWMWVWVNVVCKKMSSKKEKIKKQKVVKISGYIPVLFPFPAVSKTNYRIL